MSIAVALAELKKSPALPDHVAALQAFLEAERRRRARFQSDDRGRGGEFINGQIYTPPAATARAQVVIAHVTALLRACIELRGQGRVDAGRCLIHCQRNDYAPAVCFYAAAKPGKPTPATILLPPPALVVEILAAPNKDHAHSLKLEDYARHKIREYWIINVVDSLVEQYILPAEQTGEYKLKARLPESARLMSTVVPEFMVPVKAFFDPPECQRVLRGFLR